jgi:hypothetical protein
MEHFMAIVMLNRVTSADLASRFSYSAWLKHRGCNVADVSAAVATAFARWRALLLLPVLHFPHESMAEKREKRTVKACSKGIYRENRNILYRQLAAVTAANKSNK